MPDEVAWSGALTSVVSGASAHLLPSGGDDTTQINAALANYAPYASPVIALELGTFAITSLTIPVSAEFRGSGYGTILRQAAGTNANLFASTTSGVELKFRDMTIDGNQANQTNDATHAYSSISVNQAQGRLDCLNVRFRNGRAQDVAVQKSSTEAPASELFVNIRACEFLGGAESTSTFTGTYVQQSGGLSLRVEGSLFDFENATPTVGRAGVTCDNGTTTGRCVIVGNEFRNVGLSATAALGPIDLYSATADAVIADNQVLNPFGRGINFKGDDSNVSITGNTVDGLTGPVMDGQIVLNRGVRGTMAGNATIAGNTCLNSGNDGIALSGQAGGTGTGTAGNITVTGNTIVGATRRGLGLVGMGDVNVTGNTIASTAANGDLIFADACLGTITIEGNTLPGSGWNAIEIASTNANATLQINGNTITAPARFGIFVGAALGGLIEGNTIVNSTQNAISIANTTQTMLVAGNRARGTNSTFTNGGTNTALWVDESNWWENGITGPNRTLTLDAGGAITVWNPFHQLDTFAAAASQNLVTVNGLPDGKRVTFKAANVAHVITAVSTGNMSLGGGNFALTASNNILTVQAFSGTLYEVAKI